MDAKYIDYDYIASMHELQRNYGRVRSRCISELAQEGVIRQRLSGEITVRPVPEKLLKNVFFGETETTLQVFDAAQPEAPALWRFHWLEGNATQVQVKNGRLEVTDQVCVEALAEALTGTKEQPEPISGIEDLAISRTIVAKKAVVGEGQSAVVLFAYNGGLYRVEKTATPTGISGQQAKELLLSILKGA